MIAIINNILNIFNYRLVKSKKKIILEKNYYFNELMIYKKHIINDYPIVFDVGAHIGKSTNIYLKYFKNPLIHCFEPEESNYNKLFDLYGGFNNVKLNNIALGNENNNKELLIINAQSTGNSFLLPKKYKAKKMVPQIKLDDYCESKDIDYIDLLKLDVQGYEKECLIGSVRMLLQARIGLIKLEIMFHENYGKRLSFKDIEIILHQYDYYLLDICWIKKSSTKGRTLVCDVIYTKMI